MRVGPIDWNQLLSTYGYPAILVGTFLEGESILFAGGFFAHRGVLSLPWVIACAFGGSFLGDQTFFVVGRHYGRRILARRPSWQARVARANRLFVRWQVPFMLSFRFLYGLRTISPFCLGLSEVAWRHFLACNAVGAAVWAVAVGLAGYGFGELFGDLFAGRHGLEMAALAGLVLICLLGALWLHRRTRRLPKDSAPLTPAPVPPPAGASPPRRPAR